MADTEFLNKDETPGGEQLPPNEVAQKAQGSGIGQARFVGLGLGPTAPPKNKLPKGEDPAGWFIVGGKYVNCDGKTPDELEQEDSSRHVKRLQGPRMRMKHCFFAWRL